MQNPNDWTHNPSVLNYKSDTFEFRPSFSHFHRNLSLFIDFYRLKFEIDWCQNSTNKKRVYQKCRKSFMSLVFLRCASKGPGEQTCTCAAGYSGDGTFCVGGLLVEIGEHPQLRVIQGWIDNIDTVHDFFISVTIHSFSSDLRINDCCVYLKDY